LTSVFVSPTTGINPDDIILRKLISCERLKILDRRCGQHRIQGLAATLLLEYAIKKLYPSIAHPLAIYISESGKPYLATEPDVHFSLSHSGQWVACSVGDRPAGVDIEECRPGRYYVASRFFHRYEAQYIASLPPSAKDDAFYSLWTLKESFIKAVGSVDVLPLNSFCVDIRHKSPILLYSEYEGDYSFFIPHSPALGYRLAVCIRGIQTEEPPLNLVTTEQLSC